VLGSGILLPYPRSETSLGMRAVKYCLYKEDPYFVAQGLSVDVSSFGETREEAAANFREAVELYFEGEKNPDYIDISEVTVGEELIGA
jgi:predicted RNase H-like HicB family nuclease